MNRTNTVYQYDLLERAENPFEKLYKVYSDGSNYIARRIVRNSRPKVLRHIKTDVDCLFDFLFDEVSKTYFAENKKDLEFTLLKDEIYRAFTEDYLLDFPFLRQYIAENVERRMRNIWQREKRFRRKAYLNEWNYFVTFTFDGKKHTAESFEKKLRKCLSNLHTRRGWRFMGVTEHGEENGRLHFHFLVYVPNGQMVGKLKKRKDYSKKRGCVQETVFNTFFERQFGRNDFSEVKKMQFKNGDAVAYLLKYLRKGGERIIYSRGIPTEITKVLDEEFDICCEFEGCMNVRYILFDNVIDYERDIVPFQSPSYGYMRSCA